MFGLNTIGSVSDGFAPPVEQNFTITVTPFSGISDLIINNDFKLYPNPAKEFITLEFEVSRSVDIQFSVYSVLGERLSYYKKISTQSSGDIQHKINLNNYEQGLYFVEIRCEKKLTTDLIIGSSASSVLDFVFEVKGFI